MVELVRDNLAAILVAVVILAIVAVLLLRPRQRVRLTDSAPLRPHMTQLRDVASKDAASNVAAPVPRHVSAAAAGDDLLRLKGVGPKLADMLHARGFSRFAQLAHLTPQEIDLLDQQLGPFAGRIKRDRIVEQAAFLARGDVDGFEEHFGKL